MPSLSGVSVSAVTVIATPPGGSPIDITDDCIFEQCSFESQFNGAPGTFDVRVRDQSQTHFFETGYELQLTVDGITMFGGYVTSVGMTSMAPAADVPDDPGDYEMRVWHLTGADYNIILDRRIFRNTSDYLKQIKITQTVDGAILRHAINNYTDMSDFSTSGIDDVATIPDITYVLLQQGWTVRKEMETLLLFSGAVYYIDGDKTIIWKAYDNAEKRWGFSDVPNHAAITASPDEYQGATYGFNTVEATEDSTQMANDVFVWGGSEWAGSGGTVFDRETDTDSIDDHGRWQHAETHFGEELYKSQRGVTAVANAILDGPPGTDAKGQEKGLKLPQWQFTFNWNSTNVPELDGDRDHIRAGDLVTINLSMFGVTKLLPVRSLRISFPDAFEDDNTHLVEFSATFGLQLSDSFNLWRYVIKNNNRVVMQTQQVVTDDSDTTDFGAYQPPSNVTPSPDGSTTIFLLPFPYISGTTTVTLNGLQQTRGVDYSESGNTTGEITFSSAPLSTDTIRASAYTLAGPSSGLGHGLPRSLPGRCRYRAGRIARGQRMLPPS